MPEQPLPGQLDLEEEIASVESEAPQTAATIFNRSKTPAEGREALARWIADAGGDAVTRRHRKSAAFPFMYGSSARERRERYESYLASGSRLSYPEWCCG